MTGPLDPHAELGVPADATLPEIHSAFRRLLREHHPDTRRPSAAPDADRDQALQRTLAAYAALRDREVHRTPLTQATRSRTPDAAGAADVRPTAPRRASPGFPPLIAVTPVRWSPATRSTND